MLTPFDEAFSLFEPTLDAYFNKTFIYRRRATDTQIAILASLEAYAVEVNPEAGIYESWHGYNFLVTAAELVDEGRLFEPVAGDSIVTVISDTESLIYEIMPPPNQRCFKPVDAEGRRLLVFTKFVGKDVMAPQ